MRHILSRVRKAVEDYNMIEEGDRIAVGVSGGKDSLTALAAMKALQRFYPKHFEIFAITLDMGTKGMDFSEVASFCKQIDVPYTVVKTQIAEVVFDIRKEENPCSLCAKMRRGALNDACVQRNINKIVLGHHFDDVIETFFLSLLYEGRVNCFSPVTYLDRMKVYLLRPMIYLDESEIRKYAEKSQLPVVFNPCPANGNTKRQYVKELLSQLDYENRGVRQRIFTAIVNSNIKGWKPKSEGERSNGSEIDQKN